MCVFNLKGCLTHFHKGNLNIKNKQLWGQHDTNTVFIILSHTQFS